MQEPMKKRISLVNSVMWALLLTHLLSLTATGSAVVIQGEVGGSVTFQCQSDEERPLYLLYLQKQTKMFGEIFINGYHTTKSYTSPDQNRSQVDHTKRTIELWNLTFSDSGQYHCHILYRTTAGTGSTTKPNQFTLEVKPKDTKPTLSVNKDCHDDDPVCVVTCAACGGYPEPQVTWNVTTGGELWRLTNGKEVRKEDKDSRLFNITRTASVNCTSGRPLSFRCSVGDVTSNYITVCKESRDDDDTKPIDIDNPQWMIPAAVVLAVIIAASSLIILIRHKCKTPCPDHETGPTHSGEDMALNRMDQPAETEGS